MTTYLDFLRAKMKVAPATGFDVDNADINPDLAPHCRAIVKWALQGGRRGIFAAFGLHKCHGRGTPILMHDGSIKPVEDVHPDDLLMGDDGTPRRVISLARGRDNLFRVTLKNGDSFVCNEGHILSLKVSNRHRAHRKGDVVNMSLRDYLDLPDFARRNCYKAYKVPVEFCRKEVPFDPYLYGTWLGDGHQGSLTWTINDRDSEIVDAIRYFAANSGLDVRETAGRGCRTYHLSQGRRGRARHIDEFYFVQSSAGPDGKRIDPRYLRNDRETRLQLLAGLIDTDGNLKDGCLRIGSKWAGLRDDILYLARSLGLSASHAEHVVDGVTYFAVCLSGDTDMVPCRTRKKAAPRRQIKDPLVYGFDVEPLGEGEYFGFEIDGNHLYLLGDFTVTHNTSIQLELMRLIGKFVGGRRLIVLPLGVRHEFFDEARERFRDAFVIELRFVRRDDEVTDDDVIHVCNYESVRDGKIDPRQFVAASLDEAAILRGYGTKTYQTFLPLFEGVRFKFVATATPSPNRTKELIHYAGFLQVMDTGQALTRFFQRNSEKANELTLYAHKEDEFWLWVNSWAVFLQSPADLGFPDDGYVLPKMTVNWHEVPTDHRAAGVDRDGQGLLINDPGASVVHAAREKRISMDARLGRMIDLIAEAPDDHRILWHHLEDERRGIEELVPGVRSIFGSQLLDTNEENAVGFKNGEFQFLATKPEMSGAGCNFQKHCHRAIFLGIDAKFHDFIQAIYRIVRFGQQHACTIDIIYSEAERGTRRILEEKWAEHDRMMERMTEIIRKYGLGRLPLESVLKRSIGVFRQVDQGEFFHIAHNDCVDEASRTGADSVGLIVTSIPFSNHYEYTASYNDFGHTDDNEHFWRQMDFLTPELFRILKPGRIYACHVKDRILFGNVTGAGLPTVSPFHAEAIFHGIKHGFDYCGMITIDTDVVTENNGNYRLGYTEMLKDGTKMGVGSPEYVLLFHKPQTDLTKGYADERVAKNRETYSLARWQLDAHAHWRSSGNRLLTREEWLQIPPRAVPKAFRAYSDATVYDHEEVVAIGEVLQSKDRLPTEYMALAPVSHSPWIWSDVVRMLTLNGSQSARNVEKHICPLQFDIVDRLIDRYSNAGDVVYDPFGGLMTVPYRAIAKGRYGMASELNDISFKDGVHYCREAEAGRNVPSFLDLLEAPSIEPSIEELAGEAAQ